MADNFPNSLPRLLKNIPEVYPKLMGTVVNAPLPYRKNASNVVNIIDAVSYATDEVIQTIAEGKQQSLIGVSPIHLTDVSQLTQAIDELGLPGYLFTVDPTVPIIGEALGYPRNLSKSFYITLKNTGISSVSIPFTVVYGKFDDQGTVDARPFGLATDGIYIYSVNISPTKIVKTLMDGTYVASWETFGVGDSYASPSSIVCNNGYLYVLDTGNNRVVQTDTNGNFVATWGSWGNGNTNLNSPLGITADNDYLYISDTGNCRVVKLPLVLPSPSTPFTAEWGSWGSGNTNLDSPVGITYLNSHIYVCDGNNSRIVQLSTALPAGPYVGYWGSPGMGLYFPAAITTDGNYFYVLDNSQSNVLKLPYPLPAPATPYTAQFVLPPGGYYTSSMFGAGNNIFIGRAYPFSPPYIIVIDSTTGAINTSEFNFSFATPRVITIPSGGSAIIQYIPNSENPHTVPGVYSLVSCSFLPIAPNYNATDDYGADDLSYTLPDQPNCIEQIGNGFSVPRIYNEFLANYKNRVKLQAFGAKIAPVSILSFLKKVYPLDSNLKIYEWFTQSGVNTGFSDSRKNTSQTDLLTFITGYVGAYGAFQLDSNTGLLTSIPNLITFLGSSHPHYMYVVFTNSTFENRGTFSAGDSGISGYSGYSGYTGSYGSMFDLFSSIPTSPKNANVTKTFHSGLTQPTTGAPGEATFGGFLDTEQYSATSPAQRMAFLVNSMKAAGITAVLVQLGS